MAALLLLALLVPPCLAQQQPGSFDATDVNPLLAFKAEFANGGAILSTWTAGSNPCGGKWLGIRCSRTNRVTGIMLVGAGLRGTIPPAGYTLPDQLQLLNLRSNFIEGSIPAGWRLPEGLLELLLSSNDISGPLPANWKLPRGLLVFWADENLLSGSLPPEGFTLPSSLSQLDLSTNRFSGGLPISWQLPPSLTGLKLSRNNFFGSIDLLSQWRLPPRLLSLGLALTNLDGPIPPNLSLPSTLVELAIWGNPLGGIPSGWVLPPNLTTLHMASCQLRGTVPPGWALPPSLKTLLLQDNALEGTLPFWPHLQNASVIIQPGNPKLCGEIPDIPSYLDGLSNPVSNLARCGQQQQPSRPDQGASASPSNRGVMIGAVVGGVVGAVLLTLVGLWWWRRGKAPHQQLNSSAKLACHQSPGETAAPLEHNTPHVSPFAAMREQALCSIDGTRPHAAPDALIASLLSKLDCPPACVSQGSSAFRQRSLQSELDGKRECSSSLSEDVEPWVVCFTELKMEAPIGKGSFGQVYEASFCETKVAAKLLVGSASQIGDVDKAAEALLSWSSEADANLQREAKIMAGLRHPNILGFMGLCLQPPIIISEYCPQGSVHDTLRAARTSPALAQQLTWAVRLRMALQTALGMHYLHSRSPPILHRDLKTPNLLIGPGWTIKIADFNLSKMLEVEEGPRLDSSNSASVVLNPRWLAPEILAGQPATFASDVYSFGLVLYELLTWEAPWEGVTSPWQVIVQVTAGRRPDMGPDTELPGGSQAFPFLEAYKSLICRCWTQRPEDRPTFADAIPELRSLLSKALRLRNC